MSNPMMADVHIYQYSLSFALFKHFMQDKTKSKQQVDNKYYKIEMQKILHMNYTQYSFSNSDKENVSNITGCNVRFTSRALLGEIRNYLILFSTITSNHSTI